MVVTDLQTQLVDFVYHENRLLDEGQYQAWYELFADDGVYWVPSRPDQTERESQVSIALESKMLLSLRIARLNHPRAYSLQPAVRGMHVVQRPTVLQAEGPLLKVGAQLIYMEYQAGQQVVLGARVSYTLRPEQDSLKIVEKRIELLNSEDFLPAIQLFI